jgi:hypothetical protein
MKTVLTEWGGQFLHQKNNSNFLNYFSKQFLSGRKIHLLLLFALLSFNGWGQIAQRGSATTNSSANTNNTTLTIDKPNGVVIGDLMLLTIVQNETDNDNGGLASPTLSGWTLVKDITILSEGTSNRDNLWFGSIYYRIADGTEGSSFTFAMHSQCDMAIGSMVAFSGVACNALRPDGSTGGPFDVVPGSFRNENSSTATANTVTVGSNNSAVIMFAMCNNNRNYSAWSNSQTELFDNTTDNGDDASVGAAWLSSVNSGSTGNRTVTLSDIDRNSAILLVLRRAATFSAGPASTTPSLCMNTALTNFTHTTTGATGIGTSTGLPAGVTATWSSNTITISGTPMESGTFNYSIPLTGGCGNINATGTIIVNSSPTLVSATASSTNICPGSNSTLTGSAFFNNQMQIIAFNGFETGNSWGYTNSASGVSTNSGTVRTGSNSLRLRGSDQSNVDPNVTFNNVQLSGYTDIQLSVAFAAQGVDSGDDLFLDLSYDNGANWLSTQLIDGFGDFSCNFNSLTTTNTTSGVVVNTNPFIVNIPNSSTQIAVRIRFNETSGNNNRSDYYYIDDITLTGTPTTGTYSWTSSPTGFSSAVQNPSVTPTETTSYTLSATNNYGCVATSTVAVTVNQPASPAGIATSDVLWRGGAALNANDWFTASNWYVKTASGYSVATAAPTSTSNVFVGGTGTCVNNSSVTLSGDRSCKNLNIANDAVLNLTNASDILTVTGNWTNNGTFNPGLGTVKFVSSGNQNLIKNSGNGTETFYNLYVDNNNLGSQNIVLMNNDIKVSNTFHMEGNVNMQSGKILEIGSATNAGEVLWHDGVVIGTMKRWFLGNSAINIRNVSSHVRNNNNQHPNPSGIFPVGIIRNGSHEHKNATINFKTSVPTAGSITVSFVESATQILTANDNLVTSVPTVDGQAINAVAKTFGPNIDIYGYWQVNADQNLQNIDYDASFRALNVDLGSNINKARILKSSAYQFWNDGANNGTNTTVHPINGGNTRNDLVISIESLRGFSRFTLGYPDATLPIELKNFSGETNNTVNHLKWITQSELSSSHFEIESSIDAVNFEKIGRVNAMGISNEAKQYNFNDVNPVKGINYYRLKMVDMDGTYEYSNTLALEIQGKETTFVFFPNPTSDVVSYQFEAESNESLQMELINAFGQLIFSQTKTARTGTNSISINMVDLAPGAYTVRVKHISTGVTHTEKIIKR